MKSWMQLKKALLKDAGETLKEKNFKDEQKNNLEILLRTISRMAIK